MSGTPDVIVIGSGPNGLVAACVLARAGLQVLVLESHPRRAGGALADEQATLPGFVHDVGAGFFSWGKVSPAFRELPLQAHGLHWLHTRFESCHPAPDGSHACIARDPALTADHFGSPRDGQHWNAIARWYRDIEADLLGVLLRPILALGHAARLVPHGPRLGSVALSSAAGLSRRWFRSAAAQRVLPGLGLHVDVGPEDRLGATLGFVLGMTATTGGFAVPRGGAGSITAALLDLLQFHGGELCLASRVDRIEVHEGRARGVVVDGRVLEARLGILADTDVAALFLDLVDREHIPARVVEFVREYPRGFGTFKMDWALDGAVPWTVEAARHSAVVHAGDDLDDLDRFTREVRAGQLPSHPYLVVGQQSLADPSRAPPGKHTLWAYSRVPAHPEGGWPTHAEAFADRIEARIEQLAPGFRQTILARRIMTPADLQAMDENLVGGDLGGGSNAWHRQLVFRPIFPYFNYRTPVPGLYLCSSYAHPGAGVHGMCGYNAATTALRDFPG